MDLKIGVGMSKKKDSGTAGSEAVKEALDKASIKSADFLFVFAAPKFDQQAMLDGITAVSDAPMIGGSTAGEISTYGYTQNSVVVMAIASKDITFSSGLGESIGKSEIKAGEQVAKMALERGKNSKEKKSFVMVPDGLAGDGTPIIKGVQNVLGEDFEIVGGALGDEDKFEKTHQYFNGKVYEGCVPGVLVSGDFVTSTGIRAGWESVGNRMKCTKAEGNVVYELDGKPALATYKQYLGPERSAKLPGIALEYPFGMIDEKATIEGKEYFQLRAPLSVDKEKNSISFAAAIPVGKDVTITAASRESIIAGSETAAKQALDTLDGAKPLLIIDFDCIGRKLVLGPRAQEEIEAVRKVLGKDVPIIGFFTYGEIGPIDKRVDKLRGTRFHNQTTVLWVVGGKQ